MPLDRIVLIAVAIAAALFSVSMLVGLATGMIVLSPHGLFLLLPAGVAIYVIWRIIAERLSEAKDDPYDKIDH